MTGLYAIGLNSWNLYDAARDLLGEYIAEVANGRYDADRKRVFYDRKIGSVKQAQIQAFADALARTNFGAP